MNRETIEIVGPCSKWIQGKGWVTQIPLDLIENAGFVRKSEKEKAFWQGRTVERKRGKSNDTCSN